MSVPPIFDIALRPDRWLDTAEMLERAAALMPQADIREFSTHFEGLLDRTGPRVGSYISHDIHASMQLFPVRMALLGQALENLVKGIIVARDPQGVTIDPRRVSYPWGSKHLGVDLLEDDAGLTLDGDEPEVVSTLAEFVIWAGRFPAPVGTPRAAQHWASDLEAAYWRLSRRLRLELKMMIRAQQRVEVERQLREACTTSEHEGITLFEDAVTDVTPTVEVGCECGSFFRLSPRYAAVICLCGKLYHGRPKHVADGGMRMDIDIYPAV